MISINVEEAFAFDLLSIYEIKKDKFNTTINNLNYLNFYENLKNILGENLLKIILKSTEYKELYVANLKTFELVDKVKQNPCLGGEVDKSNYCRFICKKNLQIKFFDKIYKEIKIGYE
jgi:hypothetical protein